MPITFSIAQTSLAAAILASTIGTYMATSPPNPNTKSASLASDFLTALNLTNQTATDIALLPLWLLSLYTSVLTYFYPRIPPFILRHGKQNGLNPRLVTWSTATIVPLSFIFCVGVPLRLVPYSSLGTNFTFALAEPDRLITTGIYHYVQHPSYTGLFVLVIGDAALLGRADGVLACWFPPRWYLTIRTTVQVLVPLALSMLVLALWTRVRQEEHMLRVEFGDEWEKWHATTSRFIPWLI